MKARFENKGTISRFLYHIIVGVITNFLLFMLAVIALLPTGIFYTSESIELIVWVMVVLFDGLLHAAFSGYLSQWSKLSDVTLRMVGRGPGRFVGIFIGYKVGTSLGGRIWVASGVIGFYFLGRWMGSQISLRVGGYLERFVQLEPPKEKVVSVITPTNKRLIITFFLSPPIMFVIVALLFTYLEIGISPHPEIVPIIRALSIVYTVVLAGLPWLVGNRLINRYRADQRWQGVNPEIAVYIFGMASSTIPSIFGLVLFFLGASIVELLLFSLVSLTAVSLWAKYKSPRDEKQSIST